MESLRFTSGARLRIIVTFSCWRRASSWQMIRLLLFTLMKRIQLADGQALIDHPDAMPYHRDIPVHPRFIDHLEGCSGAA
jgi:hypothetical protein